MGALKKKQENYNSVILVLEKLHTLYMVLHITCVISETDKASDNVALFSRYFKTPFVYNLD